MSGARAFLGGGRALVRAALPVYLAWFGAAVAGGYVDYPAVSPGRAIELPADHGSHPEYRTEWWYVTGWLETADGEPLGFQVTFFRTRPDIPQDNPSAFAPTQLIIAHAALSDPRAGQLRHDQRIARAGHGLAGAAVGETRVWLDDWRLERSDGAYQARVVGGDFAFELELQPTQAPLINGDQGYSRKAPDPAAASFYYSLPQLAVNGVIERGGERHTVTGTAWLDHEWSTALLDERASGWDWVGINLDDGGSLMAFRIRDGAGDSLWAGGSWRQPDGTLMTLAPQEIAFLPGRRWRSPRTGIEYPVAWSLRAGPLELRLEPLMDDQESDSRYTTGAVYWEGAVRAVAGDRLVGRGYLELTGYGERLVLPGSAEP